MIVAIVAAYVFIANCKRLRTGLIIKRVCMKSAELANISAYQIQYVNAVVVNIVFKV
jgi:hypothetical protein